MNHKFDELAKSLAQSVTRRGALKKFGVGLAGLALASLGLASKAQAAKPFHCQCNKPNYGCPLDANLVLWGVISVTYSPLRSQSQRQLLFELVHEVL